MADPKKPSELALAAARAALKDSCHCIDCTTHAAALALDAFAEAERERIRVMNCAYVQPRFDNDGDLRPSGQPPCAENEARPCGSCRRIRARGTQGGEG